MFKKKKKKKKKKKQCVGTERKKDWNDGETEVVKVSGGGSKI